MPLTPMPLAAVLTHWRPSTHEWTWAEEEADILARLCCCCGTEGHYQRQLVAHVHAHGVPTDDPITLTPTGHVADGHHRIVAAIQCGLDEVPVRVLPLHAGTARGWAGIRARMQATLERDLDIDGMRHRDLMAATKAAIASYDRVEAS